MTSPVAAAYDLTGAAWQAGPGRVYDRLAETALDRCPAPLAGARLLDLGAGTGAAGRAARARGASVVAADLAWGMLAAAGPERPPSTVADALALSFRAGAFDAVVAAFCLNHLEDPAAALVEARRVVRPGGALVLTAYAGDDTHPAKQAVEDAAAARGWRPEPWYEQVRRATVPRLAACALAAGVATGAGWTAVVAQRLRVPFPDLGPEAMVAWRVGMAQLAPFVASLPADDHAALVADALGRLGDQPPPLVRSIIVLTAAAPAG